VGKLDGKVVIITGVGAGLGRQNAVRMAAEGARMAISDLWDNKLAETAALCNAAGAEVFAIKCDVSKPDELEAMVAGTVEQFGTIDVLVNNANYQADHLPFLEQSEDHLDKAFAVGAYAAWRLMKLCYPHLKGKSSSIINFVSGVYQSGMAGYSSYAPDKAAIRALSMVVAREWGVDGIRVNNLSPVAWTDTIEHTLAPEYTDFVKEEMSKGPLGRLGDPALDIAPALIFLASDESRWITGQNINVDGGASIHA
jgi:NAD(P)-dependent dehydrogenase (short-subunit alcohol dehydrogenase family)